MTTNSNPALEEPTACSEAPTTLCGRLRFIGPSLILTATLIGSGELILTTTLGARVGFAALWVIILSCVLKVALQESLGRYTISSGDTTLLAINRLPGPRFIVSWTVWFLLGVILLSTAQLGAIAILVGESLSMILPALDSRRWAPLVCVVALLMLRSGRYQVVERCSTFMVICLSILTILCASLIQWTPFAVTGEQLLEGLRFRLPAAGWGIALAIVGIVGLSSTELIYYPYWCLEKGYARFAGPNSPSTDWARRARGWVKVMRLDCHLALVIYTTTTVAFYLLGAAILYRLQEVPSGMDVVRRISSMYTETLGPNAYYVFAVAAFVVLFSTLFVSIASYARLLADCLSVFGKFPAEDAVARQYWVKVFIPLLAVLYALSSQWPSSPVLLMILGVTGIALMLPVIAFAAVYLRHKRLDSRLRPSLGGDIWLWVSALLTGVLTLFAALAG